MCASTQSSSGDGDRLTKLSAQPDEEQVSSGGTSGRGGRAEGEGRTVEVRRAEGRTVEERRTVEVRRAEGRTVEERRRAERKRGEETRMGAERRMGVGRTESRRAHKHPH
jgi:hypothetical protein